jgi:hypothetical protein
MFQSGAKAALRQGDIVLLEENLFGTIGYVWDRSGNELLYTFDDPALARRYLLLLKFPQEVKDYDERFEARIKRIYGSQA